MSYNWVDKVTIRLGENRNKDEVNYSTISEIVESICNFHAVSYSNPNSKVVNFVVYSTLSELYGIFASAYGGMTKITVADGVTTDMSVPVENYLQMAEYWGDKALSELDKLEVEGIIEGSGITGNITQTKKVLASMYESLEEPPMSAPEVQLRETGSSTVILWDVDDSLIFEKVEVFLDDSTEAAFSSTSRYDVTYTTSVDFSSVTVTKTDTMDRTVSTTVEA
jgi:hypothetical protein